MRIALAVIIVGIGGLHHCPSATAALPNATVVEYYRGDVDHYFMTASPAEQALLDDGVLKGWARTGVSFQAWLDATQAPATAKPVCRYYGRPEAGLDSHFYSAFGDECDTVRTRFAASWQFESPAVFYVEAPSRTTGLCPVDTNPVYRAFNDRSDANHRYMISASTRSSMQSLGWIAEGHGPDAVVMCAPKARTSADDQAFVDATSYSAHPSASLATGTDTKAVTHHQLTLHGVTIPYTATTGHLVARDPLTGQPQAAFFHVTYTADGSDASTRPITFFYNGGPGSASVWLHLGSFGPKRLATGAPSTSVPTPFPLVDNAESLIDSTDMVFVDAVGTGLSQAIAPFTNQSFWGVDKDAEVFRNFVLRYLAANGRTGSPKYLFGESYGTTRTAVLANLLETAGTRLDGIVLQSSVLDHNSNCAIVGTIAVSCAGFLPTYGSVGAYYGLLDPPPTDLMLFRAGMDAFAQTIYAPAVATYRATRTLPNDALLQTLVDTTGMAINHWRSKFNLGPDSVQVQLIPGTVIGRYDARVFAPAGSPLASENDPSSTFIAPSFASTIRDYVQGSLKYSTFANYATFSDAIYTWDFSHDGRALPDTVPDLGAALVQNPGMKVLAVSGFHDLATPYFQTELDLARLGILPNVRVRNYDGGHMTYLDDVSRPLQGADLRALFRTPVLHSPREDRR